MTAEPSLVDLTNVRPDANLDGHRIKYILVDHTNGERFQIMV